MKRMIWLLLLLSLGLNLGLGYRLMKSDAPEGHRFPGRDKGKWMQDRSTRWNGPGAKMWDSRSDSTHWRQAMSRRLSHIAQRLELTPDQVAALESVQQENLQALFGYRLEVEEARAQLHDVIAAGTVDGDQVRSAIKEIGLRQARLDSLLTEAILVEMEILDQDQRGRYLQLLPVLRGEGPGRAGGRRSGNHRK